MSDQYLFLDTSLYIQVGLLDSHFDWLHYELIENRKGSQIIHRAIYDAMNSLDISFQNIAGLFLSNGPGSYTGIRIGEGIAQVLALEGIPIYSFYHYEVPYFTGVNQYQFYERAFKGEVFEYLRSNKEEVKRLISEDQFKESDFQDKHVYHLTGELLEQNLLPIYELFRNHHENIFHKVFERKEHLPPYYFRPLDKEFRVGKGVK